MRFYRGSHTPLRVGQRIRGRWGTGGRPSPPDLVFERYRPSDQLSRIGNVFVVSRLRDLDFFGDLGDWFGIYEVRPEGQVDRHNVHFFQKALEMLWECSFSRKGCDERRMFSDEKLKKAALNYWSGVKHASAPDEYITKYAVVIRKVR